jgi:hypothetical protein
MFGLAALFLQAVRLITGKRGGTLQEQGVAVNRKFLPGFFFFGWVAASRAKC